MKKDISHYQLSFSSFLSLSLCVSVSRTTVSFGVSAEM